MTFHTLLLLACLVIILLLVIALRWLMRKLRLRRAWAAIDEEREENKRAFARLAAQTGEIERQCQSRSNVSDLSGARHPPVEPSRMQEPLNLPAFPDQQWQSVVASGTAAIMRPEQRREVEELYVDLTRLRLSTSELSTAIAAAGASGSGSAGDESIRDIRAVQNALRALLAEMHRFQPLHTDFDAVLPHAGVPGPVNSG